MVYVACPVPDCPSSAQNLRVDTTWPDHIDIAWDAPATDGGAPLTGYLVEQRNVTERVGYHHLVVVDGNTTTFRAADLVEGREYQYRVFAQNEAGSSEAPVELSDAVKACFPFGESAVWGERWLIGL